MYRFKRFSGFRALLLISGLLISGLLISGLASLALSAPAAMAGPAPAAAGPALDWRQYLQGPQHSSMSLATAFTPANAASAHQVWHWQAPGTAGGGHDWDFGSSPTLFGSGSTPPDVGACNKNGLYYALAAKPLGSKPLWVATIGAPTQGVNSCLGSSAWDGKTGALFIGGNSTAIGGTSYGGSVRQVSPGTGAFGWQTGLPCAVLGTPSLDSSGVLAVGTYLCPASASPGAYLINAATGAILESLPAGPGRVFSQPVFAQGTLFVATETRGLYNFAP